ncbi:hypothetical protein HED49_23820 [Ochrobactrum daejeonense]|nr:hypothetical protein [Brucella daejeonensis]
MGVCLTAPPLYSPVLAHGSPKVRPRACLHNGQYRHASVPIPACSGQARGQPVSAHSGNDRTDAEYGRWPRPPKPLGAARSRRRSRSHALRAASKKKGSFTA